MALEQSDLHDYADKIGMFFESMGLPRTAGRILGWLMVCDPPHQSAEELAKALHASRGAISVATRMLLTGGSVEKCTIPGMRCTYYRIRQEFLLHDPEERARLAGEWCKLIERGLDLMRDESEARRSRLQQAYEVYTFLEEEYYRIRDRWLEKQGIKKDDA